MKFNKYKFREDFIFKNNRVHLTEIGKKKIKKFKKITGSRIGAVFGSDSFKSPFQVWCEILNFFKSEPDTFFLDAGVVIEPKLRAHAEKKYGKKFVSYDPQVFNYDLFSENSIFGGIPDGEEKDSNGNVVSILEIKTTSLDKYKWLFVDNELKLDLDSNKRPIVSQKGGGLSKWFKNGDVLIPESYQDQLSLYLYLRNISKGYFCVAFLKNEDYLNPRSVVLTSEFNNYMGEGPLPSENERILIWKEFSIDKKEFGKKVEKAKKWYEDHVFKGISPELSSKDLEWFRFGYPELD